VEGRAVIAEMSRASMSSGGEDEDDEDNVDVDYIKSTRPKWKAMVMALTGRYDNITEDDIWIALDKYAGQVGKASMHLKSLSAERSITPEEKAIRETLKIKQQQLQAAQRDFRKAVDDGRDAYANHLENIIYRLITYIGRLEGPRKVAVLLVDDNDKRRAEMADTLEWLDYDVTCVTSSSLPRMKFDDFASQHLVLVSLETDDNILQTSSGDGNLSRKSAAPAKPAVKKRKFRLSWKAAIKKVGDCTYWRLCADEMCEMGFATRHAFVRFVSTGYGHDTVASQTEEDWVQTVRVVPPTERASRRAANAATRRRSAVRDRLVDEAHRQRVRLQRRACCRVTLLTKT